MNKITDYQWYNEKGIIVDVFANPYEPITNPNVVSNDFFRDKDGNICRYGIRWIYKDKLIVFPNVEGWKCSPNLSMDKVIINHGDYVAVHDADGSLLQKLPYPPEPISNLKNEFGGYEYKREYMKCYWDKKKNGKWCIAIEIWWRSWRFCTETREFNPDTLEFGGVLTTSAD